MKREGARGLGPTRGIGWTNPTIGLVDHVLTPETREQTTATREMPCCGRRVRLLIPIREQVRVHERTCPDCGLEWTFATEVTVTPFERLPADVDFEYGYTVAFLEGRPREPVTSETIDRAHGGEDATHENFLKKEREITERRRVPRGGSPS